VFHVHFHKRSTKGNSIKNITFNYIFWFSFSMHKKIVYVVVVMKGLLLEIFKELL
jgi:hypothetical protein